MATTFKIPDFNEILDVLWESISTELGIDVIRANQSAARIPATGVPEDKNYATIYLITGPVQVGDSDYERFEEEGVGGLKVTTEGQRELTLSVNIYRKGAGTLMSKLQKLFNSRLFKHRLYSLMKDKYSKELVVVEALSSQDLTSLVQSDYEERFQMDVLLRTTSEITETVDPIDTVVLEEEVKNIADETVYQGTTTISNS